MSEALRLADWLDTYSNGPNDNRHNAATELRRLHSEHHELGQALKRAIERNNELEALNAELVEALRCCRDMVAHPDNLAFIDAALEKAGVSNG